MAEDALRSLLAEFVVEVDKAGNLAKANTQLDALKSKLETLQAATKAGVKVGPVSSAGDSAFARARDIYTQRFPQSAPSSSLALTAGNRAATELAQTLRGKLATAVQHVRDGFIGGPKAEGPGLIASLATARNAFLAFAGGVAVRGVMHLVDSIGDISEAASRLGVTTDQFQRLSVIAEQNGTSVEALGTAFRTLSSAAVQPTKESTKAFTDLGVSVKGADGQFKSTNDLFFEVSSALAGITNETQRSAIAQDLLGRSAIQLKPIFGNGSAAVDEMRKSMAGLNVLSADTISKADELSDSWKTVGPSFLAAAEPLLKILLPALKTLTEYVVKGVDALAKWLKQTDLVSVALTALGVFMATRFIPGLQLMIGLGGGAARVLLTMAGAAAKAAWSFARVALPLLLIEDFITFLRGGDSETGRLLEAIFGKEGPEFVLNAVHELKDAMVDLWNWVTGAGTGEGIKRLWQEFGNGITVMINDLLHAVGIGKGGTDGPFKLAETISTGYGTGSSYLNTPGSYGPPTEDGSTRGNAAKAVTIGDTNVTITGYSAADSKRIADDLDSTLQRNRDGIVAGIP